MLLQEHHLQKNCDCERLMKQFLNHHCNLKKHVIINKNKFYKTTFVLPLFGTSSFSLSDDELFSFFLSSATIPAINKSSASNGSAGVSSLIFYKIKHTNIIFKTILISSNLPLCLLKLILSYF